MRPLFESRIEGGMGLLPIVYSNRLNSGPLGGFFAAKKGAKK
jgi:hypothetical protein